MPATSADVIVQEAVWPQDKPVVERLLNNYAAALANPSYGCVPITLPSLKQELAQCAQRWSLPHGAFLIASCSGEVSGCIALQLRLDYSTSAIEMKRLWVETAARGQGLGKLLLEAAIAWCYQHGADTLLLDTVPQAMPEAVSLYRSANFQETVRHNTNDVPGILFMKKQLCDPPGA